jgi:short-subunit dehydrogenase
VRIALSTRSEPQLDELARQLGPDVHAAIPADLSDAVVRADLVSRAERAVAPIDLVIHNAATEVCSSFERLSLKRDSHHRRVNLTAPNGPGQAHPARGSIIEPSRLRVDL